MVGHHRNSVRSHRLSVKQTRRHKTYFKMDQFNGGGSLAPSKRTKATLFYRRSGADGPPIWEMSVYAMAGYAKADNKKPRPRVAVELDNSLELQAMRFATILCLSAALTTSAAFAVETGAPQMLTSVSQYLDVKPDAAYFDSLQSLTERYGVSNGFKSAAGVEFRGDKPLSRADMIMLVNDGLDNVSQIADAATMQLPAEKRAKAMKSLSIMQGAKCKSKGTSFSSVNQIKDLKPTDAWFEAAQALVEKWSIRIASADGTFGATDAITTSSARECLKIFSPKGPPHKPAKLTRGDFVIMLNQAMDDFYSEVSEAASEQ